MRPHLVLAALLLGLAAAEAAAQPARLSETGLYAAPGAVRAEHLAFTPRHALWSDGTSKRRWLGLPPGASIDASHPDAWEFPPGTRAWKEFGFGRAIETRMIERLADGSWRFSSYVWNAEGTDAELAPARGTVVAAAGAPGGRYPVPSRADCLACHEGAAAPILGFSAVQLAGDLPALAARGVVKNLPAALLARPAPAVPPALGYLHANCGHCHNDAGPLANVELSLAQLAAAPRESAARAARTLASRGPDLVLRKLRSPNPLTRMPPLGVRVLDLEGIALVERWMRLNLNPDLPPTPESP